MLTLLNKLILAYIMIESVDMPQLCKPFPMQVLSVAIDHAFVRLGFTSATGSWK